jgi:RHS repeat-associated protein
MKYTTVMQYDVDGHVVAVTDANQHTVTTQYDPDGRPIITTYPDTTYIQVQYDALGRKQFVWDQMRQMTEYHYDALDRLDWIKLPDTSQSVTGYSEQYQYDEVGDKIAQTDANGHTTRMVYDLMGRVVQRILPAEPTGYTDPARQSEYSDYDPLGRLWHMTDNNGLTTTFTYDSNSGYLLSKSGSNGDWVSFTYNADGSIATKSRGNGSTTYNTITNTYDASTGRLTGVSGPTGTIEYAYDNAGNKVETDVYAPGGALSSKTYFGYDADNRLQTVSHNADLSSPIASYLYDNVGNRKQLTRANGVVTTYTYDSLSRLTDLVNDDLSSGILTPFQSFHYHLRPDGKRDIVTEAGNQTPGTTNYQYDADGRLLSEIETLTNGTVLVINSYKYDAVGNRQYKIVSGVETDYRYDANDRLVDTGYSFDANGNQTNVSGHPATFDFENHLVTFGPTSNPIATYSYDADGNRLSTTTSTGTTNYLVDPSTQFSTIAEERDSNGNLIAQYNYADDLISMTRSATTWYYVFDGHGSTRALTDGSGIVSDRWSYDAFGNIMIPNSGSTPNDFLFNGQQFDFPTSVYYMRARYYAQTDGRFLTTDADEGNDPDPVTLHRYLYCRNEPIQYTDESGNDTSLFGITISNAIATTIAGAAITATIYAWQAAIGGADPAHVALSAGAGALVGGVSAYSGAWVGGAISTLFAGTGGVIAGITSGALGSAMSNATAQYLGHIYRVLEDDDADIHWTWDWSQMYLSIGIGGTTGGITSLMQNTQGVPVTTWSNSLRPGRWVMLGKPSVIRWLLSGVAKLKYLNYLGKAGQRLQGYASFSDAKSALVNVTQIKAIPMEADVPSGLRGVVWLVKTLTGQRTLK